MSRSSTATVREQRAIDMIFAYEWQCPCGYKGFVSAEPTTMKPEQVLAYAQKHGSHAKTTEELSPEYFKGEFITHPKTVVCENCGEKFTCKSG